MPTRKANATWEGGFQQGSGRFEGESGAISGEYSVGSRFGEAGGTNPEELLAAAHAACYSMALSGALERAGTPAQRVRTDAACTVEKQGDGFTITTMKLRVRAQLPGGDADVFRRTAEETKTGCPVSRALAGVEIELDAALE